MAPTPWRSLFFGMIFLAIKKFGTETHFYKSYLDFHRFEKAHLDDQY
jgi:hypothetical protein